MYMACIHVYAMHSCIWHAFMYMACRVNAVVPSTINTESVQRFMEARGRDDEAAVKWADRHIIKR